MSGVETREAERFGARASAGLVAVAAAGVVFGLLLTAVRIRWTALATLDQAVADRLNALVAGSEITVNVLRGITEFGGRNVLTLVLLVATAYLLIRRQPRLAVFAVVTSLGALILDPVVKLLVERLRPVVDLPVATAPGPSFPSGHALGSFVSYGVLLLIFLPSVPRRRRPAVVAVVAGLVVLVGFTRMALGVHYLTDVLGGWALGVAWIGVCAAAFRRWRRDTGAGTGGAGLAPEAAADVAPTGRPARPAHPWLTAAELVVAAVLVVGLLFGVGVLVTALLSDSALGRADRAAVAWFAEQRSPGWTTVMTVFNAVGDTGWIITVTLAASGLAVAVYRRRRPVVFLWVVMAGEVIIFLVSSTVVTRARPQVVPLQPDLPPTASFPSGHVAGTLCLYVAIALLVCHATRRPAPRAVAVCAAVVLPAAVAAARLYLGVHHPTDIAGSVLLTAAWITVAWWLLRPVRPASGAPAPDRTPVPPDRLGQ